MSEPQMHNIFMRMHMCMYVQQPAIVVRHGPGIALELVHQ